MFILIALRSELIAKGRHQKKSKPTSAGDEAVYHVFSLKPQHPCENYWLSSNTIFVFAAHEAISAANTPGSSGSPHLALE